MTNPLINILIRVSRPRLFDECTASIVAQTYKNIRVIFWCDNPESYTKVLKTIPKCDVLTEWDNVKRYKVFKFHSFVPLKKYEWNLYCNKLKSEVEDGYFFYLDDDDYLSHPHILEQLVTYLQDNPDGLVVQFLRNGKPKPNNHLISIRAIRLGLIGGGCLVLRADHKDVADWDGEEAADYRWIKKVSQHVKLKFVPLVLQIAGNNGLHGQPFLLNELNYKSKSDNDTKTSNTVS